MLLAFILLIIYFGIYQQSIVKRVIYTLLVWNGWAFGTVELLSVFSRLAKAELCVSWGILDLCVFLLIVRRRKALKNPIRMCKDVWGTVIRNKIYILLCAVAAVVVALAFLTVPYNWDSLTYHLSRIAQWSQNQSVEHYATHDVRQLTSPVLAEFINVQVYILTGCRDSFLNLLQAGAYLVNAFLVFQIAKKLGCREKFSTLASFLFMLMPISFGEALTTQVDQFAAIWFLIFIYYFIDLFEAAVLRFSKEDAEKCMVMGLCVSFGYLAKPSVNIGMAFLLFVLLVKCIKRKDSWSVWLRLGLCAVPFVAFPILPEVVRNYLTFSAVSDPSAGQRQLVGTLSPTYLFINMIKNLVQNLPSIYLYDSEEWMAKVVMVLAGILRVNINDPAISEDGGEYILNEVPVYGHDSATNPVVWILAIVAFSFCLFRYRKKGAGQNYTIYSMLMFVFFCVLVRWEPFVSRYMLAYLAVLCPMIAWQLQQMADTDKAAVFGTAVFSIVCFCLVTEAFSLMRYHQEMWHEEASVGPDGYFYHQKSLKEDYLEVTDWVMEKQYKKVGLNISSNQFLYPIYAMLGTEELSFENVLVDNVTARYENEEFVPDCVITDDVSLGEQVMVHGYVYTRELEENQYLCVYSRVNE